MSILFEMYLIWYLFPIVVIYVMVMPIQPSVHISLFLVKYLTHLSLEKMAAISETIFIPPPNEVGGGVYWIHLVRLSVCPSVRLSVCLSVDDMVSGA